MSIDDDHSKIHYSTVIERTGAITMYNQAQSEHEHSLKFRVRRYVVIATKQVHRLKIRPSAQLRGTAIVPKLHPGPNSSMGRRRGTDRHTDGRDRKRSSGESVTAFENWFNQNQIKSVLFQATWPIKKVKKTTKLLEKQ